MEAIYNSWLYKFIAGTLNDVAWLYILLPCVFVGGLYFTVGSGFMQFKRFGYEIYHIRAVVSLAEGAGIMDLAVLMDENALDRCTVDISVSPRLKSGLSAPISLNDIPLKTLLERASIK